MKNYKNYNFRYIGVFLYYMSNNRFFILLSTLLIYSNGLFSQSQLTGYVYSAIDSLPIPGASVYYDGTSTGVSTTDEGYFSITLAYETTSALVVSSLGYESTNISTSSQQATQPISIYLKESEDSLGEVFLETDPWSRKKKLNIFRKEFLGRTAAAGKCSILNEEALKLTYIPSRDILLATSTEPLVIINNHLGYEITYDLKDFKVEFRSGLFNSKFVEEIFYEGTSFFKELTNNIPLSSHRNREVAYRGSTLEFMRSLVNKQLEENDFRILMRSFEVPPYAPFLLSEQNGITRVKLKQNTVKILHREYNESTLQASGIFYIDKLGNHTPPKNVLLSGNMGERRFAEALPLNYAVSGNSR